MQIESFTIYILQMYIIEIYTLCLWNGKFNYVGNKGISKHVHLQMSYIFIRSNAHYNRIFWCTLCLK